MDYNERKAKEIINKITKEYLNKMCIETEQSKPSVCHVIETQYGKRKIVQTSFLTNGCQMKKIGSCWNCNYGAPRKCEISKDEYLLEFKKILDKINGDVLVLEGLGSITDPNEFNQDIFKEILNLALNQSGFDNITIETHVTKIQEDLLKYINKINHKNKYVEFEIGVESMDVETRKFINKLGVDNKKIKEIYDLLQIYNIGLDINLIYGFPFMTEIERINSVINSINEIQHYLPNADITLFLMSIKENTFLEYMYDNGFYEMPNPWGFIEVTKRILEDSESEKIPLITYSWFGEKSIDSIKEKLCYVCDNCKKDIINALLEINGTFDNNERKKILYNLIKNNDGCYQRFLYDLSKENSLNSPLERYNEFLEYLTNQEKSNTFILEKYF